MPKKATIISFILNHVHVEQLKLLNKNLYKVQSQTPQGFERIDSILARSAIARRIKEVGLSVSAQDEGGEA